jgi:hypothetical protein
LVHLFRIKLVWKFVSEDEGLDTPIRKQFYIWQPANTEAMINHTICLSTSKASALLTPTVTPLNDANAIKASSERE